MGNDDGWWNTRLWISPVYTLVIYTWAATDWADATLARVDSDLAPPP